MQRQPQPSVQGQPPAQVQPSGLDLSGVWAQVLHQEPDRTAGGELVDYGGFPLNEAGRLSALQWDASTMSSVRQQQCAGYVASYSAFTGGTFRIWEERDPHYQRLVGIHFYNQLTESHRVVWMDGRPHPPAYTMHTWQGFATGRYEGNALVVHTTHLKRGWMRGNGLVQSDEATLTEHFIRHGDTMMYNQIITDPVYLTEPLVRSSLMLRSARNPESWLYPCDDAEVFSDHDRVASFLWGRHPAEREFAKKYNIPLYAALGGADTMYPDLLAKLREPDVEATATARLKPASGPSQARVVPDPTPNDGEIHAIPVQGNVYMLLGDGANIAVQIGNQGPLVVDTGSGRLVEKVIAAIRRLSDKPIQFIVNTSYHADHTGGNSALQASGDDPSAQATFAPVTAVPKRATIIGHQNLTSRLPQDVNGPTDVYISERRKKFHNLEAVEIFPQPNAITDGDSIVHFRESDVIVTGDLYNTTQYPFIDVAAGGSIQGVIDALNGILERTVYRHQQEGGTLIIPGHGRVSDEYDLSEYRDMLVRVRDRVRAAIGEGASLQQVIAARPTADYDGLFGANSGPWTTRMFIEAVYTSLRQPPTGN